VRRIIAAEHASGKRVFCGFKKMFMPSVMRALAVVRSGQFGEPVQFTCRYPQDIPSPDKIRTDQWAVAGFRDHICHPASLALRLVGPVREVLCVREQTLGGAMVLLRFASGCVGTLHLCRGMGPTGPRERAEIVGAAGGHIVIDNNIDLRWYRQGNDKPYGRAPDFTCEPDNAALRWQPEFSLGVLYNNGPFLLGYAFELNHFCQAVLDDTPFDCAGSADMLHLTALYETFLDHAQGTWVTLPEE
jgi:predicted dehydrogenase